MKRCSACGETKPLDSFHRQPSAPSGRHSYCKPCYSARSRGRKRKDDPAKKRAQNFRRRYGLTPEQIAGMMDMQKGGCAICGQPPSRPVVDHDHVSGAVRGILCHPCNIKLPAVEDRAFRASALRYLKEGV
jgi:hypothetical protein